MENDEERNRRVNTLRYNTTIKRLRMLYDHKNIKEKINLIMTFSYLISNFFIKFLEDQLFIVKSYDEQTTLDVYIY